MKWITPIKIDAQKGYLKHNSPMMLIGSCFADNIGSYMSAGKFDLVANPFGTLYNPESIAMAIERLMERREYRAEELCNDGSLWYSYHHHGKFSHERCEETLQHINTSYLQAADMLHRCDRLIVTFGTAYVYRLAESGATVANCHKQPASLFRRTRLDIDAIVARWAKLLERLHAYAPQCNVLFTVSPIRHLSDGAHQNQLSKSTLLLAVDELCKRHREWCSYFPAYEIVLDELRDYRFYAEDMTHPSSQAVEYIYERLGEAYFTPETQALAERCMKIENGLRHRPLNGSNNKNYQAFAQRLMQQMQDIEKQYPPISYEAERMELKQLISQ